MGNSDPEELAQIQLGEIWQSQYVCKCLFDSIARALPPQGNLLGGLQFLLVRPLTLKEFLFQMPAVLGQIEMILFLAIRKVKISPPEQYLYTVQQ